MHELAIALALVSLTACSKKKDAAADDKAAAPAGGVADVDCEKLMTHMEPLIVKAAAEGKSADETKAMEDRVKAKHPESVKACEAQKTTTHKMTKAQYECTLAAATVNDVAACATK